MELLLFTDDGALADAFQGFGRSRQLEVPRRLPLEQLGQFLRGPQGPGDGLLIFLDRSGLKGDEELVRIVRRFSRACGCSLAVLDPLDQVEDPAALFHLGVADYLGSRLLRRGISPQRLRRVLAWVPTREAQPPAVPAVDADGVMPRGWDEIRSGQEYSFFLMYIELDGREDMESRYGKSNLALALSGFRQFVARQVEPFGGRIWHWSRFGGLALFPFTSQPSGFVECAVRLALFKSLFDVEESLFPSAVSFRMVLHLGRLVYEEDDRGHVVADSLNTVFHFGQHFAREGSSYLSEDVLPFVPAGLRELFAPAGEYDGRRLFRLKMPAYCEAGNVPL